LKLHKQGISQFLWDTLCRFQNEKLFANYYLVGGTALSLQIGHRISDDIDLFFLLKEISVFRIVENFKRKYETENVEHYLRSMVYFDDILPAS